MPSILWFVFCLVWTEHFLSPLCLKPIVTWQPCIMHLPHPYGVHTFLILESLAADMKHGIVHYR